MTKGRTYLGLGLALGLFGAVAAPASAQMRITEWMYDGTDGEFVELTNMGGSPIDMTGWSYSDEDNVSDTIDLSGFGIVAPGQSVIFTQSAAATFRTAWGLSPSIVIVGGVTDNLSRNDAIYIYNNLDAQVDLLDFGDQSTPGAGPRTTARSGGPISDAVLGTNDVSLWDFVDSGGGDPHSVGFWTSTGGQTGNPGSYVPEPASLSLIGLAGMTLARRRRR